MDNATRLQYLEAMGIDVWVPRHQPIAIPPAAVHPENSVENSGETHQGRSSNREVSSFIETLSSEYPQHCASSPSSHANDQLWKDLQYEVSLCRACSLCETRTQTVFGVGNKHATWMLIGEAPGQNEDLQGEPFVGKAGQLLTEMLRAMGLKREEVYIANMLKCRPPNNRDPQAEEVAACNGFLQQQIELIQPKIILAVGRIAAQNLLDTQQPLAKLRGVQHQLHNIPLIVIHHPAYLLRSLLEKAKAWSDLQFALSVYQKLEK
ncbi:Uracil-DNA glycosylase, family 4 (EC 3.2.2.27) [Methylomonas albis]|uniref:Type-4 uracil-DNA glycosylase n=1 Tax=Methylomonas albis TaxID=1854563 RepID=A0ABR9CZE0_9GAMM|nr:uracil-DNA glycosylase [Methylomonas albis]MBD9355343.1 uracil-DNA glycosylase [Methylomonas albis]CAD6878308.1 Uracil-DNA glycosylase, family 4 (EC 3.2.2.27) [Methylomonas albis]